MKELSLEERKKVCFNILCEIDGICMKYNITYFLAYGTLIGTVRHKGFIPWDDDIDIWIPVQQYKKFIAVMKEESKYTIIDFLTEKKWPKSYAKISDPSTIIIIDEWIKNGLKVGVSVDVFPLFHCSKNIMWLKKLIKCRKMIGRIYRVKEKLLGESIKDNILKSYVHYNLFLKKNEMFWKEKLFLIENKEINSKYMGNPISIYRKKDIHLEKDFSKEEYMEFEGKKFPIPIGWNNILTNIYGDYMTIPKKEDRVFHEQEKAYWIEE